MGTRSKRLLVHNTLAWRELLRGINKTVVLVTSEGSGDEPTGRGAPGTVHVSHLLLHSAGPITFGWIDRPARCPSAGKHGMVPCPRGLQLE